MGSAQSLFTPQNIIAVVILIAVAATVWHNTHADTAINKLATNKKGKKKKAAGGLQDVINASEKEKSPVLNTVSSNAPLSEPTVPGGIPEPPAVTSFSDHSKPLKEKKRKGKKPTTPVHSSATSDGATSVAGPSSSSAQAAKRLSTTPPTTESWTRVEPRRRSSGQNPATSDAGMTTATSVTEEDASSSGVIDKIVEEERIKPQKTLAEKILPKGRKTAVDDMLDSSHYPELSRVMRVASGTPEKPASGFSWEDYENVEDVKGADADGEDDGGWGVVKSRGKAKAKHNRSMSGGASTPQPRAPETLTKKQRQNAAKREAIKVAKAEAEVERLALLAKHKRELEHSRIADQFAHGGAVRRGGV